MLDAALLTSGRAAAESRMRDTFALRRSSGMTFMDESTGVETAVYDVVFTTPGRTQTRSSGVRVADVAGVAVALASSEVHYPVSQPPVREGDHFEHLAAVDDASLAGKAYRVVGVAPKSQATARRVEVVEVSPPWS